ncbi:Legionella vir region protein [Legionella santicrucis]|uniref:Legionella vir region protein n=1 Tax=Legionella santicrucis TaxID=45074 RepID=A0A0W0YA44_9GAMM|nr:hypothetical protein [Legionella santicrucis]KTD53476.1 Legionella vir region protein [Legionella santicrucis]
MNKQHVALIDSMFAKFSVVYGHLWRTLFKSSEYLEFAKKEWLQALHPFQEPIIMEAVRTCSISRKHPPTIPEFVDCCKAISNRQFVVKKEVYQKANPKVVEFNLQKIKHILNMNPR